MHHLQQRQSLRPFTEFPYAWIHSPKSNKRHEENDAPENCEPKNGIYEIVEDEVLRFGRAGLERFGPWLSRSPGVFFRSHLQIS